jgi:hypothetical protein
MIMNKSFSVSIIYERSDYSPRIEIHHNIKVRIKYKPALISGHSTELQDNCGLKLIFGCNNLPHTIG